MKWVAIMGVEDYNREKPCWISDDLYQELV
jgi:hypothetical protein